MTRLKQNGGYVLAGVVVLITVMLALVGGSFSAAVHNYKAQENSVRRTQDRYTAEGAVVRAAESLQSLIPGEEYAGAAEALAAFQTRIENELKDYNCAVNFSGENLTVRLDFDMAERKLHVDATINAAVLMDFRTETEYYNSEGEAVAEGAEGAYANTRAYYRVDDVQVAGYYFDFSNKPGETPP